MRFASKTFTRRLRQRRQSKSRSTRSHLRHTRRRRQKGGGEPYRGISPKAVVVNPVDWDT
jgi:hypothetical protein